MIVKELLMDESRHRLDSEMRAHRRRARRRAVGINLLSTGCVLSVVGLFGFAYPAVALLASGICGAAGILLALSSESMMGDLPGGDA